MTLAIPATEVTAPPLPTTCEQIRAAEYPGEDVTSPDLKNPASPSLLTRFAVKVRDYVMNDPDIADGLNMVKMFLIAVISLPWLLYDAAASFVGAVGNALWYLTGRSETSEPQPVEVQLDPAEDFETDRYAESPQHAGTASTVELNTISTNETVNKVWDDS